ncbi:hypothetical protein EBZ37_02930, partial [bacterium]|nr:hypothetical protein [bacterium]
MYCHKKIIVGLAFLITTTTAATQVHAEDKKDVQDKRVKVMERVTVIGTQDRREEIAGSASIVSKKT